jgi:hypothetical protein
MKPFLLTLLLLSPLAFAEQESRSELCKKLYPYPTDDFIKCLNVSASKKKPSGSAYIYTGTYESKPFPRVQVIRDPSSKQCSIYKINNQKQPQYQGRNLAYNSYNCHGDNIDVATKHCIESCNTRVNQAQAASIAAQQKQVESQQKQYQSYLNQTKERCRSYGFNDDNAIATCVQREINLEKDRIQQQPIIVQQSSGLNYDALGNYGRCLSTQGETFSSCSNAWQGYTPPKKTVTKCRYDAFGNTITGTCTTQ